MGVDCSIKTRSEMESLDRWYVFSQVFRSGEFYEKGVFLKKLDELSFVDPLGEKGYCSYWVEKAREFAEERNEDIAIVHEHDIDYDLTSCLR